ncbi:hypothetical protein [Streptomyces sp. DH12]|uniref:hypothetical protein n=1 Tax=Streptomyces sp. DH12 TaxID=2857010 RepID=UPI001E3E07C7|nr:hypothetical protein [Streptomyces sp. DH12]
MGADAVDARQAAARGVAKGAGMDEDGRHGWRPAVSVTVLLLAAALASVIGSTYAMTQESRVGGPDGGPLTVPSLLVVGAVAVSSRRLCSSCRW